MNGGHGAFTAHPTAPTFGDIGTSMDVVLADVDGDGDLDAVTAGNRTDASDAPQGVWLNQDEDQAVSGLTAVNDGPTVLGDATMLTVAISAGTNVSCNRDFGDGSSGSGSAAAHTYGTVGSYMARETAANSAGEATATTVTTAVAQATSGLAAASDSPTALGNATSFWATVTAGSNVTYTWDFGDGAAVSGNGAAHVYPAAGVHTVVVTAAYSVSQVSVSTTVTIERGAWMFTCRWS